MYQLLYFIDKYNDNKVAYTLYFHLLKYTVPLYPYSVVKYDCTIVQTNDIKHQSMMHDVGNRWTMAYGLYGVFM